MPEYHAFMQTLCSKAGREESGFASVICLVYEKILFSSSFHVPQINDNGIFKLLDNCNSPEQFVSCLKVCHVTFTCQVIIYFGN